MPDVLPLKHEMRGVWVATVKNIDWPGQPEFRTEELKDEFRKIASFHQLNGFNALFVQVRPAADAMYPSETEPWSEWLTGEQGLPPEPRFDPLHFMIEESHNRGMEFHAWFNPYRAVVDFKTNTTSLNHISRLRPGWFLEYGDNLYFDPGIPEVREYLVQVIGEVVRNYPVDAIHFDDYFYPYQIAGLEFPDSVSFKQYGRDYRTVEDWRRDNVNKLIRELGTEIKSINPKTRFGISPFGVWRNYEDDSTGSKSRAGQTNYDHLFADIRLWLKNEWIDYVVPQIYWHMGFELADYSTLVDWWVDNSFGRHLYIGQGAYRIGSDRAEEWLDPSEMPKHLRYNEQYPEIDGNVFFSSRSFFSNPLGYTDSLRTSRFRYPALVPPMPWLDDEAPTPPVVTRIESENRSVYIEWSIPEREKRGYTLIYRQRGDAPVNKEDPRNIIAKLRYPITTFRDIELPKKGKYSYALSAVDGNNNESNGGESHIVKVK